MKALVYHGAKDVRVETVPDPKLVEPTDAIVRVTLSAICGSDLHLYDGYIPTMEPGDILGHEFMGEVVEVGNEVKKIKKGDRVVVSFPISCGYCEYCQKQEFSLCDNSNPDKRLMEALYGYATAGIYGYSHMYGGFPGGQAELVRVPFADVGAFVVPKELSDEQTLFLSDIFPTGYQAIVQTGLPPGATVAIWGAGPVGQMAALSAQLLGAGKIIVVDRFPERLALAKQRGAETINYEEQKDVVQAIKDLTNGKGPAACIDAVGMEAHGSGLAGTYDKLKHTVRLQTDRPTALREVIQACGKGGTVSIPGVYGGVIDKFPLGSAFAKGLIFRMGQTNVQKYVPELLKKISEEKVDPSYIITHRLSLDEAPRGYELFKNKEDGCIKVVLRP